MIINCNTDFQPLKEIAVGQIYHSDSFNFVKDPKVREPMKRVLAETEADLQNLCDVLESYNVIVHRPDQPPKDYIRSYIDRGARPPIPPMSIRDSNIVVGDTFYRFNHTEFMDNIFDNARATGNKVFDPYNTSQDAAKLPTMTRDNKYELAKGVLRGAGTLYKKHDGKYSAGSSFDYATTLITHLLEGPSLIRLGDRLIIDSFLSYQMKWCHDEFKDYTIYETSIGGHSDGCFCPVKPGLYLHTIDWEEEYKQSTPGWEGIYLKGHGYTAKLVKELGNTKYSNGRWWIQDEAYNDTLSNFINTWLTDWMGQIDESIFDVNLLSINENLVLCMSEPPKEVKDAFKKHNVEYHIVPFRHRFFWDGGLHCITLDLHREGGIESYFHE